MHFQPCHRGKVKATPAATRDGEERRLFSGMGAHPHHGTLDWRPPRGCSDAVVPDGHSRSLQPGAANLFKPGSR
ncbi:hypothetical protein WDZ92_41100 [Nostoc sp. NIES-2111]